MVVRLRKALFSVIIVGVFLASIVSGRGGGGPLTGDPWYRGSEAGTSSEAISVGSSTRDSLTMNVVASGLSMTTEDQLGTAYERLKLDGAVSLGQVGAPDVPVYRRLIAIPKCDSIRISISEERSSVVEEVTIWPLPRTVSTPDGDETTFTKDDGIYSSAREFPGSLAKVEQIGCLRGQRIALVGIYPVQFNPVDNRVRALENFKIKLEYANPQGELISDVGPFQNVASTTLLNYQRSGGPVASASMGRPQRTGGPGQVCWCTGTDWRSAALSAVNCGADYLVITADEFDSSLVDSLAERRADLNGFNVAIVKMSQIHQTPNTNTTPDSIRGLVKAVYDSASAGHMSDERLGYVLLVGDAYDSSDDVMIPSYYGFPPDGEGPVAVDAYYSLLSDPVSQDLFSDVFLGRIPVNQVEGEDPDVQLRNVVRKTRSYACDAGKPPRNLMVSGDICGIYEIPQVHTYFAEIRDRHIPAWVQTDTLHRYDYPPGTLGYNCDIHSYDNTFSVHLADSISLNDYMFVAAHGHGNPMELARAFRPLHYGALTNDTYPMVFLDGCEMGHFDYYQGGGPYGCVQTHAPIDPCDAMAEALLIQGHGAIGVLAYSRNHEQSMSRYSIKNFYRSVFQDNAFGLGEMLLGVRLHGLEYTSDYLSQYRLTLFGDPALNVMWETGEEESVYVDLAVRPQNVRFTNAFRQKYVDVGETLEGEVIVENLWKDGVDGVTVTVWDGPPGSGASLDTVFVGPLDPYSSSSGTVHVSFESSGLHEVYVVVDTTAYPEPTYRNNSTHVRVYANPYLSGFPRALSGRGVYSLTIGDVSPGVFGKELLVGLNDELLCVSSSGGTVWSSPTDSNGGYVSGTPCVGNIFKDGRPYCLWVDDLVDGNVRVVDGETGDVDRSIHVGLRLAGQQDVHGGYVDNHQIMSIADIIEGDSALEFLLFSRRLDGTHIEAYSLSDSSGASIWDFGLDGSENLYNRAQFACGDINGDGSTEVVVAESAKDPAARDSLYVLSSQGGSVSVAWARELSDSPTARFGATGVILLDRDDDGHLEILTAGVRGPSYDPISTIYLFGDNGTLLWNTATPGNDPFFSVGDLDADDILDIVVASGDRLRILAMDDGAVVDSASVSGRLLTTPLIADIDGDENCEILTVADRVSIVPGESEQYISVYDHELQLLNATYVFPYSHGVYNEQLTLSGVGMPAVDDLDGDGILDVAFVSADSVLHVFRIGDTAGDIAWGQKYKNPMQTGVVAQTISGHYSDHLSLVNDVRMLGDVTVDSALYVDATARVTVAASDNTHGGNDTTLCEITVKGSVGMIGSETSPVSFVGTHTRTGPQYPWVGIVVDTSCDSAFFRHVKIQDAVAALKNSAPVFLENCLIRSCQSGLHGLARLEAANCDIEAEMGISVEADMELTGSSVTGEYYGLSVAGGNVHLDEDTLSAGLPSGSSFIIQSVADSLFCENSRILAALYGVTVSIRSGHARLLGTHVSGADIAGVYLPDSCAVTVDGCTITDNDIGIEVYRNPYAVIRNSTISNNHPDGIYVHVGEDTQIEGNEITGNTVGIYCYDGAGPAIRNGNEIYSNTGGIKCEYYSSPIIRGNKITNNATGVAALDYAEPDLGVCVEDTCDVELCDDQGLNGIYNNSGYHICNFTAGVAISALCNYWKGRPSASKFYGDVAYEPYLGTDPWQSSAPQRQMEDGETLPTQYSVSQNYPNPFNPTTTIAYDMPAPGENVRIAIYDVLGRAVRVLVSEFKRAGRYTITWDGRNSRGENVASGVYFLRMSAGEYRATRKLLVLK